MAFWFQALKLVLRQAGLAIADRLLRQVSATGIIRNGSLSATLGGVTGATEPSGVT